MGHFPTYHVLPEGVAVFLIKLDASLEILCNLDTILVFDGVSYIISIKDIICTKKLRRVLVEATLPLPIGRVEEPIISCIGGKGEIVIFLSWYSCTNMYLLQCPRSPLIPNYHLKFSCGRQYFQMSTY